VVLVAYGKDKSDEENNKLYLERGREAYIPRCDYSKMLENGWTTCPETPRKVALYNIKGYY